MLGNLFSNVHKGEIQGQSLGIDVDVFTDDGNSTADGDKGELVVKQPFPSMPVKFWGDDDGKKYHMDWSASGHDLKRERERVGAPWGPGFIQEE